MRAWVWALLERTPEPVRRLARPVLAALRRRKRRHTPLPPGADPFDLPAYAVEVDTAVGTLWLDGTDAHLTPWVQRQGVWEADVMRFLTRRLGPGGVFADVGANVGFHTVLAAQIVGPSGKVFAIEPVPTTLKILRANLVRHNLQVVVLAAAASDVPGHRSLEVDPSYRSGAAFADSGIEVRAAPLDELLPDVAVDVLKIDVEGAEPLVLRGAHRVLERSANLVALVEFRAEPHLSGEEPEEVLAFYESLGLELCLLRRNGDVEPTVARVVLERARRLASLNLVLQRR